MRIPLLAGAAVLSACASAAPEPALPELPAERFAKCSIQKSQSRPLIVEWPSADRAALESLSKRGMVVVRYTGCEMKLLSRCSAAGAYRYTPVTLQSDRIVIHDVDDLYAKVPIGAARLEAELERSGELGVELTVVGTYDAPNQSIARDELSGDCSEATHVLTSLSVGAFELTAGARSAARGAATIAGLGAGAERRRNRSLLSRSGDRQACGPHAADASAPPLGCGALLRVEATPIAAAAPRPREESPAAAEPAEPALQNAAEPAPETPPVEVAASEPPAAPSEAPMSDFPERAPSSRVLLGPGMMIGLRGPFTTSFGTLEDGVKVEDIALVQIHALLEIGYRIRPELAIIALGGARGGSASRGSETCPSGSDCELAGIATGIELMVNNPSPDGGAWGALGADYELYFWRRNGESEAGGALVEYDTNRRYHTLGGHAHLGIEWPDSAFAPIRYGFMIGYQLGRVVSTGGSSSIGGSPEALSGDGGFVHTILFGGRIHGELGARPADSKSARRSGVVNP